MSIEPRPVSDIVKLTYVPDIYSLNVSFLQSILMFLDEVAWLVIPRTRCIRWSDTSQAKPGRDLSSTLPEGAQPWVDG